MHRILGRHGLNRLSANQKHRPHRQRWQRYDKPLPGHRLLLDVKFLERIPGTRKRLYQVTTIDDCTRLRVLKVYDACNQRTAIRFIDDVRHWLPFRIHGGCTGSMTRSSTSSWTRTASRTNPPIQRETARVEGLPHGALGGLTPYKRMVEKTRAGGYPREPGTV